MTATLAMRGFVLRGSVDECRGGSVRVRAEFPYATDAAHDARSLRRVGRGDCVAKAGLLAEELATIGIGTRLVRWQYLLPTLVAEQQLLAFDSDVHTAVQARINDRWVLIDATHDPALSALGLVVGRWDWRSSTEPAYPPQSPIWVVGNPQDDRAAAHATRRLLMQIRATNPEAVSEYRTALNALFAATRNP